MIYTLTEDEASDTEIWIAQIEKLLNNILELQKLREAKRDATNKVTSDINAASDRLKNCDKAYKNGSVKYKAYVEQVGKIVDNMSKLDKLLEKKRYAANRVCDKIDTAVWQLEDFTKVGITCRW